MQATDDTLAAIPSGPAILPRPPASASPGDRLSLNCSLHGCRPVARLQWYINKTPVSPTALRLHNNSDGTTDLVLSLALSLQPDHFSVSNPTESRETNKTQFKCLFSLLKSSKHCRHVLRTIEGWNSSAQPSWGTSS